MGAGYILRRPTRRATASGGGTNPGDESAKTSPLVSNSLCIASAGAGTGAGDGAAAAAAAAFFWRRRFFLEEARPRPFFATAVASRSTLPMGSATLPPPTCTGMTKRTAGRSEKRAQDSGAAGEDQERVKVEADLGVGEESAAGPPLCRGRKGRRQGWTAKSARAATGEEGIGVGINWDGTWEEWMEIPSHPPSMRVRYEEIRGEGGDRRGRNQGRKTKTKTRGGRRGAVSALLCSFPFPWATVEAPPVVRIYPSALHPGTVPYTSTALPRVQSGCMGQQCWAFQVIG